MDSAYGTGLVVTGRHFLLLDTPADSARLHRPLAQQFYMQPLAAYAVTNMSSHANYADRFRSDWSAVSDPMPLNVHLLTFGQFDAKY